VLGQNNSGAYFLARFLTFFFAGAFFALFVTFFDFDFFFVGAAVFADFFAFAFFFVAGIAPFSAFGRETLLNLDRTAFKAVPIGFSPFADDSPTIAPAIPVTVATTGPPTRPPITAPAMPPATGLETRGRFAPFFFLLAMMFLFLRFQIGIGESSTMFALPLQHYKL
jgi:hypothetical protein